MNIGIRKFFQRWKVIVCSVALIRLLIINVEAEDHANPFLSYIRQIEFLEKQLEKANEKQKPGIQKRLDDVRKQKDLALEKRKEPFVRKLKNLKKYLAEAKSDSKKTSLQNRINEFQVEINRLDAYAKGATKYELDKKKIDNDQNQDQNKKLLNDD